MMVFILLFSMSVLILSISYATADVKTYYGDRKKSYARFKPWNATFLGTVKFKFKTQHSYGILFYTDDHRQQRGRGHYMKLKLNNKRLELHLQVSYFVDNRKLDARILSKIEVLGRNLNDNHYHFVEVQRRFKETLFSLDGRTVTITFNEEEALHLNSSMYIGGVPHVTRLFVDKDVIYETRFVGCISNLRYDNHRIKTESALPMAVVEEETGCHDACHTRPTQTCYNGGRCLNKYIETGCDCRGTGYTGENCLQESETIQFSGQDYLLWKPRNELNNYATDILLRFKTTQSSGILIFARGGDLESGYILIELYEKSLLMFFKTKDTKEEVVVLGDNQINQTAWKFLRVLRVGESVSIELDDGSSVRRYLKQNRVDGYTLPSGSLNITQVFVGGLHLPSAFSMSRSKTHFIGCMQDIIINKFDVLHLARDWSDYSVKRVGNVKSGCHASLFLYPESDDDLSNVPSLTTQHSNRTDVDDSRKKKKKVTSQIVIAKKRIKTESVNNLTWIIIASSCVIIVILITAIMSYICLQKQHRKRRYREHYLRQNGLQRGDEEELPLNQRCIRTEINRCDLKTFSPVRRAFYVSPNEPETLQRTDETVHRSYEAMVRNRDDVYGHKNEVVLHQKTLQHSHTKRSFDNDGHYAVEVLHSGGQGRSVVQENSIDASMHNDHRCHRLRGIEETKADV